MPDMTNAEAAKVLNYLIDKHFLEDDWREAFKTALTALTPHLDENGHALCGCGGRGELFGSSGDSECYCVECDKCDIGTVSDNTPGQAWERWDLAMGLRRDA